MLSKQLTTKLKEEQEKEAQQNSSHLNVAQCDRLIRTVSCKHDTNHVIKKNNINVLQSYDETKLYISPNYTIQNQAANNINPIENSEQQQLTPGSTKLRRRNESFLTSINPNEQIHPTASSEIGEINVKDLIDQIVDNLSAVNVSNWFIFGLSSSNNLNTNTINATNKSPYLNVSSNENLSNQNSFGSSTNTNEGYNLFESVQQALNHIDFNLKRNSDFINELTKLLDTSRSIKQEAQLKKVLKILEEERNNIINNANYHTSQSQPPSPSVRSSSSHLRDDDKKDDSKKKLKSRSFKGLTSFGHSSKIPAANTSQVANTQQDTKSAIHLAPPNQQSQQQQTKAQSVKDLSSSLSNIEANFRQQLLLQIQQQHEVNNSDYIELEIEVEKISYNLDSLYRLWSKLYILGQFSIPIYNDQLKNALEFQTLISSLNSPIVLKELEQSLFKLNWLITSKSGFSEPNWQANVLSLTPSTIDSFIGVNLLKNYYKYVKYDFVSYKLFTRQLQLIQLCAIILIIIHRILVYYRESITVSSISNTLNGLNNANITADSVNSSLLSFTFSADKFRPISWSANHVTLYNVQSNKNPTDSPQVESSNVNSPTHKTATLRSANVSRSSSARRPEMQRAPQRLTKEEQMRQIKNDLFLKDLAEFLELATLRLNIQANLTNRTGYFYIVNQSTGLVLQAVDFSTDSSLKEQIEQHQKRLQSGTIKDRTGTAKINNTVSKGPRFYLMSKLNPSISNNRSSNNTSTSLANTEIANDEQLWYYYLINGCVANKTIRSGYCMAASSLNAKSPVCFWPNVKTTNCSWFFNNQDQTIVSGLNDELVLDYIIIDEPPNQRYAVVIDTKIPNKASQKWSFEFC